MISQRQIERMVQSEAYGRLAARILENGRCLSPAAADRLSKPSAAAPAGLGLALQRVVELSYGPEPLADRIADRLVSMQQSDGLFGSSRFSTPAASAVALRGLLLWGDRRAEAGIAAEPGLAHTIRIAIQSVTASIADPQSNGIDETDLAVILWQLADRPQFRRLVDLEALLDRMSRADGCADNESDSLARYVHAMAA